MAFRPQSIVAAATPRWAADRPWVVDTALALALGVFAVVVTLGIGDLVEADVVNEPDRLSEWLIVLSPAAAVPFRRVFPSMAAVGGSVAQAAVWSASLPDFFIPITLVIYSGAVYGGRRGRITSWTCTGLLTAWTTLGFVIGEAPFYAVVLVGLLGSAATAMGVMVASRQAYTEAVEDRARHAELSRIADRERAIVDERSRIARELHDVVAHGLSVIVVQSAAAKRILDNDREGARNALDQIEQTGRNALTEMRYVLDAIRTDPAESWRPTSGLAGLDELIDELGRTGLEVTLDQQGDPRGELPVTIDLAAYRIVQESLTNVLKHGGSGASATVQIVHGPSSLDVSVVDDGDGARANRTGAEGGGEGYGLRGMQERIEVFGGRFSAGPKLGGGYAVKASIPLDGSSRS